MRRSGPVLAGALLGYTALAPVVAAQTVTTSPTPGQVDISADEDVTVTGAGSVTPTAGQNGISAGGNNTILIEAPTVAGGGTVTGGLSGIFTFGSPSDVDNSGTVTGETNSGIRLFDGGSITNRAGATIEGQSEGVSATGAFSTLENDGAITGMTDEAVQFSAGGTIDNSGTLTGGQNGGAAVRISGGTDATNRVSNSGTIEASTTTPPSNVAVFLQSVGGLIENLGAGAEIIGAVGISAGGETNVVNEGTITSDANGSAGTAISITGGGSIENRSGATINGSSFGGVSIQGGPGDVTNDGTINASVTLNGGGTVDNSGEVNGSVQLTGNAGGVDNSFTNRAGGTITMGGFSGSTIADATIVNNGTMQATGAFNAALTTENASITTNTGEITSAGGNAVSLGSFFGTGGLHVLNNQAGGQIVGSGSDGVTASNGTFEINNDGLIRGEGAAFGAGIFATVAGSVTNAAAGVIENLNSGTAIEFLGFGSPTAQSVTNFGTINGNVLLGDGDDSAVLGAGSSINSVLDGQDDTDSLSLIDGAATQGNLDFDEVLNFESLVVDAPDSTWTTTGSTAFSDGATLNNGTFRIGGTLDSSLTVNGGIVGGSGTVGSTTVSGGGTVAPGDSIGTLTINGAFSTSPGSIYQVEVNPSGEADLVVVTDAATLDGGLVDVQAEPGTYPAATTYTILTATTGVAGTFDGVASNMAFLTPMLTYDPNNVFLTLTVTAGFTDVARTRNQRETAAALETLPADDPIVAAMLPLGANAARGALDVLSGEIHATLKGVIADRSHHVRAAAFGRLTQTPAASADQAIAAYAQADMERPASHVQRPHKGAWARVFGSDRDADGDGNAARVESGSKGFLAGADGEFAGWRAGLVAGYEKTFVNVDERDSSAEIDSAHLGIYAGRAIGRLAVRLGAAHTWHELDVIRNAGFARFSTIAASSYDARSVQVFGELARTARFSGVVFEPFVGLAWHRLSGDDFRETGGAAALTGLGDDTDTVFTSLGIRASRRLRFARSSGRLYGSLMWQHAEGDVIPQSTHAIGGARFTVAGTPMARDSVRIEAGVEVPVAEQVRVDLAYSGRIANGNEDHGVRAMAILPF